MKYHNYKLKTAIEYIRSKSACITHVQNQNNYKNYFDLSVLLTFPYSFPLFV